MSDPHPIRADFPDHYPFATRWEDIDVYAHVNNVKYYSVFDTAVNGWLRERSLIDPRTSPVFGIVVETQCTFLRELVFPQTLDVGLRVTKLGTSSVTYDIAIFPEHDPDPAARGRFVHVYVDRETRRPAPIPDAIRSALQTLQV